MMLRPVLITEDASTSYGSSRYLIETGITVGHAKMQRIAEKI